VDVVVVPPFPSRDVAGLVRRSGDGTRQYFQKPRKASAGQKEMLLPIEGKKPAAKKAAKSKRPAGRRKAG
jgi:hypothetical protein